MNCPKALELIKESQDLHTQALAQIHLFSETFFDMRPKNDLNIFTELRAINTEYERIKSQINKNLKTIESLLPFTYEKYLSNLRPLMLETYKKWQYTQNELEMVGSVTSNSDNIHIDEEIPFDEMRAINRDAARTEANKSKIGELYISSESIDFETAKIFIPTIPEDIEVKGVSGVMKYIHETYKDTHIIPDLKYYHYLAQLSDQYVKEKDPAKKEAILKQIPEQLRRDRNPCYFPSSALVDELGRWISPFLYWVGNSFSRDACRVDSGWDSFDRVVLLER